MTARVFLVDGRPSFPPRATECVKSEHIRYFLQPAIALLLGFHAGRLDARAGSPPYVLRLLRSDPSASRCAKASSRSSSH